MNPKNLPNHQYQKYLASLVGKWVKIETTVKTIDVDFTFLTDTLHIPIEPGERMLSLWMAYVAYTHKKEVTITPLEP